MKQIVADPPRELIRFDRIPPPLENCWYIGHVFRSTPRGSVGPNRAAIAWKLFLPFEAACRISPSIGSSDRAFVGPISNRNSFPPIFHPHRRNYMGEYILPVVIELRPPWFCPWLDFHSCFFPFFFLLNLQKKFIVIIRAINLYRKMHNSDS